MEVKVIVQHLIESFSTPGYTILKPISVNLVSLDGHWLARLTDANVACYGDTELEALSDMEALTLDTYDLLLENQDRLGPDPEETWAYLQSVMSRDGSVPLPESMQASLNLIMRDSRTMMREWVIRILSGEEGNGESLREHMREIASYRGLTIESFDIGPNTTSVQVTFEEIPAYYIPNCIILAL